MATPAAQSPADVSHDMMRIFGAPEGPSAAVKAMPDDPVRAVLSAEAREGEHRPLLLALAALCFVIAGGVAWAALGDPTGDLRRLGMMPGQAAQPALPQAIAPPKTDALVISHRVVEAPAVAAPAKAAPVPKIQTKPSPVAERKREEAACDPAKGEMPASCHAVELALADQQLRLALARAANSGMNPKLLTMFQRRWWQVRQDVASDPAYVTAAYRQLTREIDAARING